MAKAIISPTPKHSLSYPTSSYRDLNSGLLSKLLSCLTVSIKPMRTCLQTPPLPLVCSKNLYRIFYSNENRTVLFMMCFLVGLLMLSTVLGLREFLSMGMDASLVVSEKIQSAISPMRRKLLIWNGGGLHIKNAGSDEKSSGCWRARQPLWMELKLRKV
ncbi:hypothetical protein OIU74_001246 [Salix koriyanagi]|uniref:Uncharacterized protein n=1 Tax=Salix koriyanagi TaxID=2511006 RepID=A0A9Q0X0V8_9ROSI|nr:hypothetical protein OIU74_001246 [Salix koriyanagi]